MYMDIAWFGIVAGSTMAFLSVYATRQGANPGQIGLLSAVPALVNLLFALPAGGWLSKRPLGHSVFLSAVGTRIFYVVMVFLPVLLLPSMQVSAVIMITLLMSIPATALNVGFNAYYGEIVPMEWRGHMAGARNAIIAVVATVVTLASGQILNRMAFPTGYLIVFGMGALGAIVSTLHLYLLARLTANSSPARAAAQADRSAQPQRRLTDEMRAFYFRGLQNLRLDVMAGPYARVMALLFGWHFMQFLSIPTITPFVVNELHASDQIISLATGGFNITMFIGSLFLSQATARFGNKRLVGVGIILLSAFPILTAFGLGPYILSNIIGGFAWAAGGGALFNYILERVPGHDRPAHLAWYTLVSNAAILLGSLTGPALAGEIGFFTALILYGIGRIIAGLAILRWG